MKLNSSICWIVAIGLMLLVERSAADEFASDRYRSVAKTVVIDSVEVASRDVGIVDTVAVKVGDYVDVGTTLIVLDDRMIDRERRIAALNHVIAELDAASEADLLFSRRSHEFKQQQLAKANEANQRYAGTVTTSELEQATIDLEQARLSGELAEVSQAIKLKTVELKMEEHAIAELKLSYRTVRAPISGTVVEVRKHVGEAITASEVAVRIINLDRLRVVSHVSQHAIDDVHLGDEIQFLPSRASLSDQPVKATVTFINPELNAEEGVFEIWAEFDNRDLRMFGGEVGTLLLIGAESLPIRIED